VQHAYQTVCEATRDGTISRPKLGTILASRPRYPDSFEYDVEFDIGEPWTIGESNLMPVGARNEVTEYINSGAWKKNPSGLSGSVVCWKP
jgi:hypothetical protein